MRRTLISALSRAGWLAALTLAAVTSAGAAERDAARYSGELIEFGSSTRLGSFFPVAQALCDAINDRRKDELVRCVNLQTGGSLFNVNALEDGRLQMSMAIESVAKRAFESGGPGKSGLRVVALAYPSITALVVHPRMGFTQLSDLKDKAVWIGSPGSNGLQRSVEVIRAAGMQDQMRLVQVESNKVAVEFCAGRVDALLFAVTSVPKDLAPLLECGGVLRSLPEHVVKSVTDGQGAVTVVLGPQAIEGHPSALLTVGSRLLILSHERVSSETIDRFARGVDASRSDIRDKSPMILELVSQSSALRLSIPAHQGVIQYQSRKPDARPEQR